jgi:hypothetical protein
MNPLKSAAQLRKALPVEGDSVNGGGRASESDA